MSAAWHEPGARQPHVSRRLGRWGGAARCVYCGKRCAPNHFACRHHGELVWADPCYGGTVDMSVESGDK